MRVICSRVIEQHYEITNSKLKISTKFQPQKIRSVVNAKALLTIVWVTPNVRASNSRFTDNTTYDSDTAVFFYPAHSERSSLISGVENMVLQTSMICSEICYLKAISAELSIASGSRNLYF